MSVAVPPSFDGTHHESGKRTAMHQIAIIGAGTISAFHADAWKAVDGARLAAVVDVRADQARSRAEAWNVGRWETDYRAVLDDPSITACDVCVPHHLHAAIVQDCLRAGKHVLCEKPLALDLDEARAMVAAAREAENVLMLAENWYYIPTVERALEIYRAGRIGTAYSLRANLETPGRREGVDEAARDRGWRDDPERAGGGILLDAGHHTLAVARRFMGEADAVCALEGRQHRKSTTGVEDTLAAMVRFEDGATGLLHFAEASGRTNCCFDFVLLGTKGVLSFDLCTQIVTVETGAETETFEEAPEDGMVVQAAHFIDCIETGCTSRSSGEDQVRTLALVLAAYASAADGGTLTPVEQIVQPAEA